MILASIVLFGIAVVLGLWIVVLGLRFRRGSLFLAVAHVGFAVLGLGLLARYVFNDSVFKLYNVSALLFFLTLLGGLVLMALRINQREYRTPPSMFMVTLHAIMGLLALLLLVLGYARY